MSVIGPLIGIVLFVAVCVLFFRGFIWAVTAPFALLVSYSERRACAHGNHDMTGRVIQAVPLSRGGSVFEACRRCGHQGGFIGFGSEVDDRGNLRKPEALR